MKISWLQKLWIQISATIEAVYLIWEYGFDEASRINYKKLKELKKQLSELQKRRNQL